MYFEEFTVGQSYDVPAFTVTREQIIAFAKDYDPLPLHLDEDYAKTTRFGGLVSSGVMTFMLLWTGFIKAHNPLGAELVAGRSNHMSWPAPTYPGDTLSGTVTVVRVERRNPYNGLVELSLTAYNQNGEQVVGGGAECVVLTREQA
ncbi:MAG: MaoC family dehydratase N-terminal domain-containing protein [Coriobacteriales bacterium]|jgi:acyl dehydratase|nr:MaoC family dehydratase N-terminal domain-containing protein [Coriobacteriales bacterium]